jgi:phosphoribosylformylglycinamidine cyclo-ligase
MSKKNPRSRYAEAGVDIDAGNVAAKRLGALVRGTFTPRVIDTHGSFAGLFSIDFPQKLLRRNYKNPVLAACTDGVGTKLKLAFMTGIHNTVGIDLVAMSVNDLVVLGAEPLFFLDYMATGKLEPGRVEEVVSGVAEGCKESGCALIGGETAEMPDFYAKGEYDLAGFAVGVLEKKRIIDGRHIRRGDVLIGLHSSGIHSNGYSLVRKIFFKELRWKVGRRVDELGCTLGEELLKPTRIYARAVAALLAAYPYKHIIKGIAHITGGGLVENVPRILPKGCSAKIEKGAWEVPPIFRMIKKLGRVTEDEMYRVFNMGIGMVIIVPEYNASRVVRRLKSAGCASSIIGEVRRGRQEAKFADK